MTSAREAAAGGTWAAGFVTMFTPGSVVAGYRIRRVVGAGGMGTVYLARNPVLPRYDALKILSSELSADPGYRARFIREADVAAALGHPNIVAVYGRGETDGGQLWIAMRFVDGPDADAALAAGAMTPARAVRIVGEIAKALDFAHRRSVVHRDVKPANVLLTDEGAADEQVLLGDFGIARPLDDGGLTATGSLLATLAYAAPEVVSGTSVDGRADLYSLGCTLFRLLTGKTPFDAQGLAGAVMAHLRQPPPLVTDHVPWLPGSLNWVIATAMAKDPARRFQSGRDLASAAAAALHDQRAPRDVALRALSGTEVTAYAGAPGAVGPRAWRPAADPRPALPPLQGPPYPGPQVPAVAVGMRPPRWQRRGWIIATVTLVVALSAGGVAAATLTGQWTSASPGVAPDSSTPTSSTRAVPPVAVTDLQGLLLPAADVSAVMGVPMNATQTIPQLATDSDSLDDKGCAAPYAPGQQSVYAGSGWLGGVLQSLDEPAGPTHLINHHVVQGLIAFPNADMAQTFLAAQKPVWGRCVNRPVAVQTTPVTNIVFGDLATGGDGTLTMTQTMQAMLGWVCSHVLGVRNNVAVDVIACNPGAAVDQATGVFNTIAAKITQG
jgi:hypothetical protein